MELRTERLVLRPLRLDDIDDLFAFAGDGEYARYLPSLPQAYTRGDAEVWVAQAVLEPWDRHPVFAIVLNERVVGGANIAVDTSDYIAELGYAIARDLWGKGLTPEAAKAVM